MISVNKESIKLVKKLLENEEVYKIKSTKIEGATVIDCGVNVQGGWEAGRLFTNILFGGINKIEFGTFPYKINDIHYRSIIVSSDYPIIQQAGCNISGWELKKGVFAPILAGPVLCVARKPKDWFEKYSNYEDTHNEAIITIESSKMITSEEVKDLLEATSVEPKNLYILIASSGSLVSSIQVSGRIIEQSLHRLKDEGFNIDTIIEAHGFAVIPPVVKDDLLAMGRLNDVLIYGGQATFTVNCEDREIEEVISKIPSINSSLYGKPFKYIYEENGCNFFNVPMNLYSPAKIVIINERTGKVFTQGNIDVEVLEKSFSLTI